MHQHVARQAAFVRGHVAALRAAVDLLTGVQVSHVLLELHRVEGDEGAEVAAELLGPGVPVPLVLQEDALVGAGEAALGAVVGLVAAVVGLHVRLALEDQAAGVVATLCGLHAVHLGAVPQQVFVGRAVEGAAVLEAGQRLAARREVVSLHVSFKQTTLVEALAAGRAGIAPAVNWRWKEILITIRHDVML